MSVGLFIPLPEDLASKFPSLGDHDTSPPHATLLYFGDAPEDRERFLSVLRSHLSQWPGEITATLRGLRYFDNPDATVAYDSVRFDTEVAGLRSSLIAYLSDNGFHSEDRSPVYYHPHVTLEYLPPNSVGEYDGPVPEGMWTFNEVEVWGLGDDPVSLPLGGPSTSRIAARYKYKKKIETQDGDEATVYEYGPRQIANRHREKAERVEHLRKNISDLRKRVRDDLKSDDPMTRMTALAVSLLDHTCERVGNAESADKGHYGVTGWLKKHVTFGKGTATIRYVGKSGVDHEKTVDDGPTVTALKKLCEGRGKEDSIFDTDDAKVTADDVNDYLAEFDVTAKDIRGFRANDEMCKALRAERAKGPKDLPRSRKERDEILKAEFKRALATVAEIVGHTESILRDSYLVPGLEDSYVHDGTVITSLKTATKSDSQREDEAAEKLVKPAPKKKPPRHDLRNHRVEAENDPDLDNTDDDLSLNFKKVASPLRVAMAVRVSDRYLRAKGVNPSEEGAEAEFLKSVEGKLFKTPKSDKKDGVSYSRLKAIDPEAAKSVREKFVPKGSDSGRDPEVSEKSEADAKKPEEKGERKTPLTSEKRDEMVSRSLDVGAKLSGGDREGLKSFLSNHLKGMTEAEAESFSRSLTDKNVSNIEKASKGMTRDTVSEMFSGHDKKKVSEKIREVSERRRKSEKELSDALDTLKGKLDETELERAKEHVESLERKVRSDRDELNGLVADYASKEVLASHLTDVTKGSSNPQKRLFESVDAYGPLTKNLAAKRLENGKAHFEETKKALENAPDNKREGLKKELEAAEIEVAVGTHDKYLRMSDAEAEEDPKASFIRSLDANGIGANDKYVQTLLRESSPHSEAAKAVHNLVADMTDEDLATLGGDGHLYEILREFDALMPYFRQSWSENLVGEFSKGRAKGKADKSKADNLKQLAEAAKGEDLTDKQRKALRKVVLEKTRELPPSERETVTNLVELDIHDASPSSGENGKKKGPSSPGEYRQMLLEGAGDEEARRKIKDLSSEELDERFEKYKSKKTAGLPPTVVRL